MIDEVSVIYTIGGVEYEDVEDEVVVEDIPSGQSVEPGE